MKLLSERLRWAIAHKEARDERTVSFADIARAAGSAGAAVNHWLNDTNGIGGKKARLVGDFLGVDALWLETGEGEPIARPQSANDGVSAIPRTHRLEWIDDDEAALLQHFRQSTARGKRSIRAAASTSEKEYRAGVIGDNA